MDPPATFFASSSFNGVVTGNQSEEELLTALRKGSFLLKHGRHGKPKVHFFRLYSNELRWRSASGAVKSVVLASVRDFLPGQATEVFRRHPVREPASSFSLRYIDSSGAVRTLDLTCKDREQYALWYPGLQIAVHRSIEAAAVAGAHGNSAAGASQPMNNNQQQQQHHQQQQQQAVVEQQFEEVIPGDLFIWGSASNPSFNRSSTPPLPSSQPNKNNTKSSNSLESKECWPRRLTPTPVPLNSIIDASTVSVGRRHAAIVSAQGYLYVLGEGSGGKLGRGHDNPAPVPHRTTRGLPGDGKIVATSCGDEYTAAITPEGQVFTWGRLPGESLPAVLPTLLRGGLTNVSVCQVSCGPFHTAAVASDGRLFTWGEGFGGKLGHGDQITRLQPTHVVALQSMPVLQVACGVWHTAAIVLEPPGVGLQSPAHVHTPLTTAPMSPGASGTTANTTALFDAPPSPIHSSTKNENMFLPSTPPSRSHHRRASSSIPGAHELYQGYQEGRGGSLYTWGGVNEVVAFGSGGGDVNDVNGSNGTPQQRRDSNKGCLGHGVIDLYTGQTVPTRVGGTGCQVRSVAAGLHVTVALATTGVVYQMGSTGASGNNSSVIAPWEGAKSPEPVKGQLANHFVDAIACGMHHVVALARSIEKKIGRPIENSLPSVFTWGRGSEGQLGTGKWDDSPSPVAIEENLKNRRVVAIAAGGATTMVVCDHDLKKFEDVVGGDLKNGKEAMEITTKTLLALLEPRSSSTRIHTFENNGSGSGVGVNGGVDKSNRSGWLLTRDERPPSRSNIFRGSSSFSFTSAASGAGSLGAGSSNNINNNAINRQSPSSSSMQSFGSGGGGNEINSSYPYSIISISGMSSTSDIPAAINISATGAAVVTTTTTAATASLSRRSSLNYHQTATSPRLGTDFSNSTTTTTSSTTPTASPGPIKGARNSSLGGGGVNGGGGLTNGGGAVRSLTASPGAGSSSSSLQRDQNTVEVTKGRYIARLEQRLEALQLLNHKNKNNSSSQDGGGAEGVVEQGDEKLKQAVAESAIQYRESMKYALGNTFTPTPTSTTAAVLPQQPSPLIMPPPSLHLPQEAITTPSNPISDPTVLEELLQKKEAELQRQQQALAAWAEELRRKEDELQQQKEQRSSNSAVDGGILSPSLPQQQQQQQNNNDGGDDEMANHPSASEIERKDENEEEWVEQLEQGVTATFIRDLTTGTSRLKRLRFSKTYFTASSASVWYNSNTARLTPSSLTETGSSGLDIATHPPPSVALSESVTTTPSKVPVPAATMASPMTLAAAAVAGGGNSGSGAVARQMVAHGRVDSRNMSFDARELAQMHGIDLINTSFVMTTPFSSTTPLPPLASSPSLIQVEIEGADQQEFHTPLTKFVNGRDDDKLYEQGGTGVLHSTGIVPSPALESLFNQAATTTQQTKLENEVQVEGEGNDNEEATENKNGSSDKASSSLNDDNNANDDDDDDVSLVSASSGERGRGRGRNTLSNPGGASTSSSIGAVLSPPPPRRPSPIRRPRSSGSNGYANHKVRSFALSDVMSTASLSPTTSARSLDVASGNFNRPGSQSPVDSSAAASTARGGSSVTGSGSGLLRSVAAKIARSIIGGEEYYTNISIPSPTASAPASSIEQQQRPSGATTTLVFGGRRPKSASESKR